MRQLKITHSITNRDIKSLDKYLQDICSEELLTPEEEVRLAQRIKAGDQEALDRLTKANLRFVVSVAKQYQNQGLSLPDLINEGNVGLIKAAKRFDETRGFKFISYAVWWIRQSILQAIAENSRIVRLPSNQLGALNKLKKEISRLEQELERPPSEEELADMLDIPEEKIKSILGISGRHISIDAPLVADEDVNFVVIVFHDFISRRLEPRSQGIGFIQVDSATEGFEGDSGFVHSLFLFHAAKLRLFQNVSFCKVCKSFSLSKYFLFCLGIVFLLARVALHFTPA